MRTLGLLKKLLLVGSAFFLSVGAMAQNGLILVSGTDFSCEGKESEAFTDVTAITGYLGIIKPSISMNLPVAETTEFDVKSSDFVDGNFYAITNNPTKLDSFRLYDNKEAQWGLMLPKSKGTATVMSFQVNGLSAGSPYRVEVDYCFVADYDIDKKCGYPGVTYNTGSKKVEFGGIDPKIRFVVNPDQYNVTSGPDVGFTTAQKTSGGCATQTVTAATSNCGVVSSTGELKLNINATQQTSAIFITGIRVYATVTPKVSGSETVCAGGENGLLSVGAAYVGATYQWYKDDKLLTGETGQKLIHTSDLTNAGSYKYHYVMTVPDGKGGTVDIESEKWTVEDVVCCQDDNGNPQSRKLIYKNDFGTFTSDKGNEFYVWDYTDLSEPKKKYYKTTTPFISNLPAIGIEAPEGALNTDIMSADAHAIVAFISDADGAKIGWAAQCDNGEYWGPGRENGPFFPDHTDQYEGTGKYGAALFVNAAKGNHTQNPIRIYKQEIEGICEQTHLTVKCFINNFSDGTTPIRVRIKAYDSQHPNDPQYGGESPIIERDATGKDQGWKEVSVDIPRIESRSLTFEILDYSENSNDQGDDLILDDIMVYACSSPSVDLYFDLSAHSKEEETCDGVGLKLMVDETVMLKNFYDPDLAYLYQYNIKDPDDADFKKSWINLNTTLASNPAEPIYEQLEAIIEQIKEKADGTDYPKVYFRVVAGIKDIIQNTINKDNYFNPDDPCSNMSISKPIELTIDCPSCSEPADPVISAEGGMVNKAKKTVELCKGESTVLTTNDITGVDKNGDPYADYTITWHKETATSAALEKASPAVVAPELTVAWDDVTEDGVMYIVKVHDIFENEKGTTGCDKLDTIVVIANPVPEKTLAEVKPFCEGTLAANEAPTLTIDGYKLHWYEDADTTKATKEPSVIDKEAKEYEYFYVLEDSKTGCKGEVNPFAFTVNAIPTKVLEDAKVIEYIKGTGSVDISEKAGLEPTKEEYTLFWSTSAAAGDDGSKTAPKHDITKEDKVGKSYYVYQKNEETGCYGEKSEIVVIVNDSPKPVTKDTVVCKGKTIDDLSSLAKRESEDYELLWYASESDAKEDGVGTPSALTAAQSEAPGEYIFYVAQKNTKTGAISEKAEIKVTVVGVDKPKVEDIDYCTGDDAAPLNENVTLVADESKFTYQSGLEWFVNKNAVKDEPVVETNVINTTPVRYAVRQVYEIPSTGEICQGDTAGFTVKTTFIGLPAVNATVTYVSGDLVGNTFEKNLLQQKEGAVETTDESYSLVWYDAEKNKIGDGKTPPTPVSDPAMVEAGKDQTFTYYVKQTDGTCEGELTEVKVIISSTPMPIVKNINFCEDEEVISIETLAEVNDNKGTIDESLLRLVWVDSDADDAAELAAPPTLSSDIEPDEMPVKTTKYYVKQAKKNEDGSESFSSASEIIVKVYAKAQLKDKASMPGPVCEKAVDLKEYWMVSNQVDIELEVYTLDNEKKENIVYKSGLYDVVASFTVPKPNTGSESAGVCASEPHDIDVRIDELTVPGIVGTETTCPNTSAEGLAVEFETNYEGNDIKYSWSEGIKAGSGKEDVSTDILEGVAGDKFDFTVEVTAGTCTKTSPKHTITLGDGPVVGSIKFTEAENTDLENGMEINVSSGKATLYTCGTTLTMDPTALENTNEEETPKAKFEWTSDNGSPVGSAEVAEVNPTEKTVYRVTYINKCATFVDITVIPVPLEVGGAIVGADICENESASIDAQIQCIEKPESIKWSRNGEAVSKYDGEGKLVFEPAKPEDSGEYTCVVTNRACVREIEPQTLLVKPYVKFAPEKEEYVIRRGETVNIINTITVPSDVVPAEITWTDNGKAVENSGKDYSVEVTKDMNLNVEMTEEGKYCPSDVDIVVKVDAVLQLAGEISDANMGEDGNYKMCLGETKTLVIDTTGTGKFVYPEKMSLAVTESQAGGSSKTLSNGTLNSEGKLEFKISPSTDATYSVSFVYREGEGEDKQIEELEIKITVLQKIEVKVPNGLEVCEGEEVEIALESVTPKGTVITWEDETIEGGKAEGETVVAKPTFSKPANGGHVSTYTYTAYASFDICETAEFPVKVKVNEPLTGELEDVTICENETARLDASSYKATSYIWTSDELETERSGQGITVTPKSTAVFKVSMERGGCKAEDELTVTVNPNPLILQVDSLSYRKIAVVVDATHNGKLTYRIDDGTESSFAEFDSLAYAPHVAYVTDEYGCSSSFDFMINAPLIIPNKWMSPNGDGETDRWEVPAISETYPDAKIVIYDRFGKKLIEYKGSDPGWDGVYNGQLMPTTDYWYEITVHEIDKVYTGHFTLLRR